MSGDVQPRRRKDKKKKRDDRKSEGEVNLSRQQSFQEDDDSSHGVQSAHMGTDDQHIHVYHEPHTGGHWFAKILFFILMIVMLGLVGMIMLETRGLSDLDTPLSESRYSNYLHGWVEEHREEHDDHHHDKVATSVEEHDEHDEHDEPPFEEEEDHSDVEDEEEEEGESKEKDKNVDGDEDNHIKDEDVDINVDEDEDEDDEDDEDDDEDENNNDDNDGEAENENDNEDVDEDENLNEDEIYTKKWNNAEGGHQIDNDNNDDDDADDDDDNEEPINITEEVADSDDDDDGDDENDDEKLLKKAQDNIKANPTETVKISSTNRDGDDDDDDFFDEEDEVSEDIFLENDADEVLMLKAKEILKRGAKEIPEEDEQKKEAEAEEESDDKPDTTRSYLSRLAINIGVGVALALVARFVLMQKNPKTKIIAAEDVVVQQKPSLSTETLMKRRVTTTSAEEPIPEDHQKAGTISDDEELFSEEEIEIEEIEEEEEEIEYIEEEELIELDTEEDDKEQKSTKKYTNMPQTFEEFNAMYRPKSILASDQTKNSNFSENSNENSNQTEDKSSTKPTAEFIAPPPPFSTAHKNQDSKNNFHAVMPQSSTYQAKASSSAPSTAKAKVSFSQIDSEPKKEEEEEKTVEGLLASTAAKTRTRELTHAADYQPAEEEIDYDEVDDNYDGDEEAIEYDEDEEEDEEDEEELLDDDGGGSDIDDSELMNRLEAKYGRLPAKEYESDEDPDDPTWTQIKEKPVVGGPLAQDEEYYSYLTHNRDRRPPDIFDDIVYEDEMERANDELLRQHHGPALIIYAELSKRFPDRAGPFLGQARIYEYLADKHQKLQFLKKSIEAYKRYLAFNELLQNDREYRKSAESCIQHMRTLGYFSPALNVHQTLVKRFAHDPDPRNQLVLTLLMMERYSDAKIWLEASLQQWLHNGLSLSLYGYILKMYDSDYAQAVVYLQRGIDSRAAGTQQARFYLALGESYERLGLTENAYVIYKRGAQLKLFPSRHQRSVYNQPYLRAQPIWSLPETTYAHHLRMISGHWRIIRDEALSMLNNVENAVQSGGSRDHGGGGYFRNETENLLATGNWKELLLFSRGERHTRNCQRAATTCWLIELFKPAARCRRGQVKFSVMQPGTHVWPHCGPTNSRLRAHLGLIVPQKARMRVVNETLAWTEGEFIVFDDSFEHEVWHEGERLRLILIVDFWHPDLTEQQISSITKI